jgi:murein DD-endopeptidase MepM/ murein hydrolase activator NlpD
LQSANPNISRSVYRYNPDTCRYERARPSVLSIFFYVIGIVICAATLLGGMLLVHDFVFDSERETSFRNENKALRKHQVRMTAELAPIEAKLASLKEKDQLLHQKFFGSSDADPNKADVDYNAILFLNKSDYPTALESLKEKSDKLIKYSKESNAVFADKLTLTNESLSIIASLPLGAPVKNFDAKSILSGFGKRINPFHKGLYEHQGIDIALPRLTEIVAPSNGIVTAVQHNDLQAGYGNYIEIDHGNGIITRYAHLDEINVRIGQRIKKGERLGLSGNSGGSIAPHLHYEIIREGQNVNPFYYIVANLNSGVYQQAEKISSTENQSLD